MKKLQYRIHKKVFLKYEIQKIINMCIAITIMIATFATLSCTILFKIKNINIIGISDERVSEIQEILNKDKGKNLLLYNTSKCKDCLVKSIPYVDNISIIKNFPYNLLVNITNAEKIGVIKNDDKFIIISQSGNEVYEIDNNDEDLPIISGLSKNGISPESDNINNIKRNNFLELLRALKEHNINNITGYDISLITDISFEYDKRIKVNIGTIDDIDYKLATAKNILEEKIDISNHGTLDVSSSSEDKHSYFIPN